MKTELVLFVTTFCMVFFLGFQSLCVNKGHYFLAFCNSFIIGGFNLVLYKLAPNATVTEIIAYLCGGPLGIVSAMKAHSYLTALIHKYKNSKRK